MFNIRHLLLVLLLFGATTTMAQQETQFSQFMYNQMSYNPGYAGVRDAICSNVFARQQWLGFTEHNSTDKVFPQTYLFTVDAPINFINSGVGLQIQQDELGYFTNLGVKLSYAYHLNVGPGRLGLGANIGFNDQSIDYTKFIPIDAGDPVLLNQIESDMMFDIGFGAYYRVPNQYYVGLSSTQLLEADFQSTGADIPYSNARHYFLTAGYFYTLPDPSWVIQPNILIKSDLASTQFDINALAIYNNQFWGGVTYRASDAIALMVGAYPFQTKALSALKFGYAYDITTSAMGRNGRSGGSHELYISYCFKIIIERIPSSYGNTRFL